MGERPRRRALIRIGQRLRDCRRWIYGSVAGAFVWSLPLVPYPLLAFFCRRVIAPVIRMRFSRQARRNLEEVLGDRVDSRGIDRIIHEMADGLAMLGAETAGCLARGPGFFLDRIDDAEALATLHAFERQWPGGFLGITGHIGNWEIMAMWMAHRSRNGVGAVMAKRIGNRRLHRVVEGVRRRLGLEPLYPDDPPSKSVHLLKQQRIIGLLPDQDLKNAGGMFVGFMGRPAYTPLGPARLAWAARVPMLIAFCTRTRDGRFRIDIPAIIHPDRSRPKGEELARLTTEWSHQIEAFILTHPEQWAWFHDRWKTTPEKLEARGRTRLVFDEPPPGEPQRRPARG